MRCAECGRDSTRHGAVVEYFEKERVKTFSLAVLHDKASVFDLKLLEKPRCIAHDEEWRAFRIHEVALVRADFE